MLGGKFFARGGDMQVEDGNIEASATGNLIANGTFRCAPNGCIALTAGGTVNTTGGSFDKPVSSDCPLECAD